MSAQLSKNFIKQQFRNIINKKLLLKDSNYKNQQDLLILFIINIK